jgi:hypothetical protein
VKRCRASAIPFRRRAVEKTTNKPIKEEVLKEFPPFGKYRIICG